MNCFTIWWMAASALLASVAAHAQSANPDYLTPFEARQLAPGIHLLATPPEYLGPAVGNITLIEQQDGIVVIDTGLTRADGDRVVRYVRSLTTKPVKAVVITHWHNDHPQGASQIRDAWPKLRLIATEATRQGMKGPAATSVSFAPDPKMDAKLAREINDFLKQLEVQAAKPEHDEAMRARYARMIAENRDRLADFAGTYLVEPNEILDTKISIDDPDRPVELMFLGRANTAGDVIAWLPAERFVITGDVVVAPTPFGFFSHPSDWITVIGKLKAIGFTTLIPGHGEPQVDSAYLDKLIATISDIRGQVGKLAREGLSLEEVRKRVNFDAQTAIFGTTPRLRRMFDAFWITPMVENAYKEAKGQPIIQGGDAG